MLRVIRIDPAIVVVVVVVRRRRRMMWSSSSSWRQWAIDRADPRNSMSRRHWAFVSDVIYAIVDGSLPRPFWPRPIVINYYYHYHSHWWGWSTTGTPAYPLTETCQRQIQKSWYMYVSESLRFCLYFW